MRVASYAKSIGRTVPFAQAAFRQAFAGGHSLADPDYVLIAAAACEMHPSAILRAAEMRSVSGALADSTAAAAAIGVRSVPAVAVAGRVFDGERALEEAAEAMSGAAA
jgi:2-hydroxychromene-2-carboxylate isomerase